MGASAREVLAANVNRLMAASKDLTTVKRLHARSGVSTGTIDRLRRSEAATGIDNIGAIAAAFDLQAWQLLVPDLQPTNPPILVAESPAMKALFETLRNTTEAIEGRLRDSGNTRPGGLD